MHVIWNYFICLSIQSTRIYKRNKLFACILWINYLHVIWNYFLYLSMQSTRIYKRNKLFACILWINYLHVLCNYFLYLSMQSTRICKRNELFACTSRHPSGLPPKLRRGRRKVSAVPAGFLRNFRRSQRRMRVARRGLADHQRLLFLRRNNGLYLFFR